MVEAKEVERWGILVEGVDGDHGGRRGGRGVNANFDPLACYQCGVRGHLAHDCPSNW